MYMRKVDVVKCIVSMQVIYSPGKWIHEDKTWGIEQSDSSWLESLV